MGYDHLRTDILHYLDILQRNGFSYQFICNYINDRQSDYVLYKDFFSRFRSNDYYLKSPKKKKKLEDLHQHMRDFFQEHTDLDYQLIYRLENVVSQAVKAKFEAFLEVDRSSMPLAQRLATFYVGNRPAYLNIERDIQHKKQYRWELDLLHYHSRLDIQSVTVTNIFDSNAVVTTSEYWKLWWVDKNGKKLQFHLDVSGEHNYLLSRCGPDDWKIIETTAKTQSEKMEPEFIDYAALEALYTTDWEKNKLSANHFLAADKLFHCIAFIKTAYSDQLLGNHSRILDRIWESSLNSYRLLNTDVISYGVFKKEIGSLKKQLRLIINSIFLNRK